MLVSTQQGARPTFKYELSLLTLSGRSGGEMSLGGWIGCGEAGETENIPPHRQIPAHRVRQFMERGVFRSCIQGRRQGGSGSGVLRTVLEPAKGGAPGARESGEGSFAGGRTTLQVCLQYLGGNSESWDL